MPTDPNAADDIVVVENLSFSYEGRTLFERVGLRIARGDTVGIVGSNGSGKTTLAKLLSGLLSPDSGNVSWHPADGGDPRGKIGYVGQEAAHAKTVLPVSVEEFVAMGTYLCADPDADRASHGCGYDSIDRALEHVGLQEQRRRLMNELSGGQRQRVHIARALISRPEALIMDEPTSGVDSETREQLAKLLQHLNEVHGITVITVSHDREEVRRRMRTIISLSPADEAELRRSFPAQRLIAVGTPRH